MGDLTRNFSRSEFACKCGCGFDDVSKELVLTLQDLRDHFGEAVNVTSACRCKAHNAKVGGAKASKHLLGVAADVKVRNKSLFSVYEYLSKKYSGKFGVIEYSSFVHIDMRREPYRMPLKKSGD